jgi:hypothetical protein
MKFINSIAVVLILMLFSYNGLAIDRDYYQIKIYWIENESQEKSLDQYFESALLPALHRAGIEKVGVFKPIEGKNEDKKFVMVCIPVKSLDDLEKLPETLKKDGTYLDKGQGYIEAAHDNPSFTRIESILLRAFSSFPQMGEPVKEGERKDRVYELRSYEAATELLYERKVEMFNQGESELFVQLGFNPLFFAEVLSSAHMPHLMYMITFSDEKSQEEHWNAFRDHPDWLAMKDLEKYQNTVSSITRYLLYPTAYSDL